MWEYRAIDLAAKSTREDEIDVLNRAGEQGWELVAITPPYRAMLRRARETRSSVDVASGRPTAAAPSAPRAMPPVAPPTAAAPAPAAPVEAPPVKAAATQAAPPVEEPRVAPKYRDPVTGETWSGRGRMANWLATKVKAGEPIEKYLIAPPA